MSLYNKLALFVGGRAFSDRLELNCCPAKTLKKHMFTQQPQGDYVMETVTTVQENASDILASAKDLNEERAAKPGRSGSRTT